MTNDLFSQEIIESKIFFIRGKRVLLDRDLADLFGVSTRRLKEQVKRNPDRFPDDFMFVLTNQELTGLRSQNATLAGTKGPKYSPYVFTEHGVAMLSSVLTSKIAIQANIQIMRTFTHLRQMLLTNELLRIKIEEMEKNYDYNFKVVFEAIKNIVKDPDDSQRRIGFRSNRDG